MFHRRFEVRDLPRHVRSIGRQLGADRVEKGAELSELVVLIEIQADAEFALAEPCEPAANDVNRPEQQLCEQHRHDDGHGQRGDGRGQRGSQRSDQVVANQQRRDAHPNGSEFGVAAQERMPEHERLPLASVDGRQLHERRPLEQLRQIVAVRQRLPFERSVAVDDRHPVDVGNRRKNHVFGIQTGLENRSQARVVAQRPGEIARFGDFARAIIDRVRQVLRAGAAFLQADTRERGQVQNAQHDDHHADERRDAEHLLALDS